MSVLLKSLQRYAIAVCQKSEYSVLVGPEDFGMVIRKPAQNVRMWMMELILVAIRYKCELRLYLAEELF